MKAIIPLLLLLFTFPNVQAAAVLIDSKEAIKSEKHISRKGAGKTRALQNKLVKWVKGKNEKQRKDKFGRIGLIFLFGGLLSLFLTDVLFLFALLAAVVFSVIGLVKDERKTAAIFALALPAAVILLTLIFVGSAWGQ